MKSEKELEEIINSVLNDFKVTHGLDVDKSLLSQWCKEIALKKAKESLEHTIIDLPICNIMQIERRLKPGTPIEVKEPDGTTTQAQTNKKKKRKV